LLLRVGRRRAARRSRDRFFLVALFLGLHKRRSVRRLASRVGEGEDKLGDFRPLLIARAPRTHLSGMVVQLCVVLFVLLGGYCEGKVAHEQEFDLQRVHFVARHTPHLAKVCVVVVLVVIEFRGQHHPSDQQSMNVERTHDEAGIVLDDAVDIDQCEDEALPTARGLLGDPQQIVFDRNRRGTHRVEFGEGGVWSQDVVLLD